MIANVIYNIYYATRLYTPIWVADWCEMYSPGKEKKCYCSYISQCREGTTIPFLGSVYILALSWWNSLYVKCRVALTMTMNLLAWWTPVDPPGEDYPAQQWLSETLVQMQCHIRCVPSWLNFFQLSVLMLSPVAWPSWNLPLSHSLK